MSVLKAVVFFLVCLSTATSVRSQTAFPPKVINTYPCNGSQYIHPSTNIGISFSDALDSNLLSCDSITVFGTHNKYTGTLKLSVNRKTLIYIPAEHFLLGDTIHVHIGSFFLSHGETTEPYSMTFSIQKNPVSKKNISPNQYSLSELTLQSNSQLPIPTSLPQMNVLVNNGPTDGLMYLTGVDTNGGYLAIVDKNGNVQKIVLHQPGVLYADFKPNPNGTYSYFDGHAFATVVLDSNFSVIRSINAPTQYTTDGHETRFTSEDNCMMIGNENVTVDMRNYVSGGDSVAIVVVPSILMFDKGNNLIWVWRSLDHFKITDATEESFQSPHIDFCHINAIEFDGDSNLIITSRDMDENTKIDRNTGAIVWRWGGKNNQFRLVGDTIPFSHQHATRRTAEGTYTIFDDGNFRQNQLPYSRAIEYRLDTVNHTATKIWEFRHTPDIITDAMGYVERLPDKGTFIGWGNYLNIAVTEVDSANNTRFEMALPDRGFSYRAYKYDTNYIRSGLQRASVSSLSHRTITTVFPNPMIDAAKIDCDIPVEGYGDLGLCDCLGREVSKIYSGYLSPGRHEFTINSLDLPAGIYYLRVRFPGLQGGDLKVMVIK